MAYTNIDDPSAHFQTATYTGNGSTQSITNDGNSDMQPDWVWIKSRSDASWHSLQDSSRGATKTLFSNATDAEVTYTDAQTSFDSDGFSLGADASGGSVNVSSRTYAAWQWKANGGTTSTNNDGDVTSTVQVNQDAGFSIVTWTVGLGAGNHSVGHGLGVKPAMFITKSRGNASFWTLWHQGMAGDTSYIRLDATTAELTYSDIWGDGITSSVFGYNYPATVYVQPYVAYCFAEKQGFSKFGSYVGNGSNSGPFIYTGFRPAFVMIKRTDSTGGWTIYDNKRGYNGNNYELFPHSSEAEYTGTSFFEADILSNGFKLRLTDGQINASGGSYIYMAFAENPFVTSTGIPTTAR
jgi:hypothetical protein